MPWQRDGRVASATLRAALIVGIVCCTGCSDTAQVSPSAPLAQTAAAVPEESASTAAVQNKLVFTGAQAIDTTVVINEFASRLGPDEECSEFIELRNDGPREQVVGGWKILASSPAGGTVLYATVPVGMTLAPGCHLLVATSPTGFLRDAAASCNLADAGGVALTTPEGLIVDQVGMSSGAAFREGAPLAPFSSGATRSSYARVGADTSNNATDFVFGPATPRNRFEDCAHR